MGLTNFPNGVSSFGVPVLGGGSLTTTGKIYFVDSGSSAASNGNAGTDATQPKATLAGAHTSVTTDNGDIIILMPGHAESLAATITISKSVQIVGLGIGASMPNFTVDGTTDQFTITGDDVIVEGIYFTGHASSAAPCFINVQGDRVTVRNNIFLMKAKPTECINVETGADDFTFEFNKVIGSAAGAAAGIVFEGGGATVRPTIHHNTWNFAGSAGCDDAIIFISESNTTGVLIHNELGVGLADGDHFIKQSGSSTTGLAFNNVVEGADVTDMILSTDGVATCDSFLAVGGKATGSFQINTSFVPALTQGK